MTDPQTPYAETEILLAALEHDHERVAALLADCSDTELFAFRSALTTCRHLSGIELGERRRRRHAPRSTP